MIFMRFKGDPRLTSATATCPLLITFIARSAYDRFDFYCIVSILFNVAPRLPAQSSFCFAFAFAFLFVFDIEMCFLNKSPKLDIA